jgi:hypothetical protein
MSDKREYFGGVPQPTDRERQWANSLAKIVIGMIRGHQGEIRGNVDEFEGQVPRELCSSLANFLDGN